MQYEGNHRGLDFSVAKRMDFATGELASGGRDIFPHMGGRMGHEAPRRMELKDVCSGFRTTPKNHANEGLC